MKSAHVLEASEVLLTIHIKNIAHIYENTLYPVFSNETLIRIYLHFESIILLLGNFMSMLSTLLCSSKNINNSSIWIDKKCSYQQFLNFVNKKVLVKTSTPNSNEIFKDLYKCQTSSKTSVEFYPSIKLRCLLEKCPNV